MSPNYLAVQLPNCLASHLVVAQMLGRVKKERAPDRAARTFSMRTEQMPKMLQASR